MIKKKSIAFVCCLSLFCLNLIAQTEKYYYLISGTGHFDWTSLKNTSFGNINEYNYDEENPLIITSDTDMTRHNEICSDIIIRNNSTLNITNAEITLSKLGTIIVEEGSSLVLEGGTVQNANLHLEENANLTIVNGGNIILNEADEVQTEQGATVNIYHGSINLVD